MTIDDLREQAIRVLMDYQVVEKGRANAIATIDEFDLETLEDAYLNPLAFDRGQSEANYRRALRAIITFKIAERDDVDQALLWKLANA